MKIIVFQVYFSKADVWTWKNADRRDRESINVSSSDSRSNGGISASKRGASVQLERSVFTTPRIQRRPEAELFAVARLHPDRDLFLRRTDREREKEREREREKEKRDEKRG